MGWLGRDLNPRITDWAGRWVWLVGASSGIGRALAEALHRRGARVIVSARQAAALQDFAQAHPGSLALPLDVTDADAVQQAAARVAEAAGACRPWCCSAPATTGPERHRLRPGRDAAPPGGELPGRPAPAGCGAAALLAAGQGHLSLVGSVAGYRGLPMSLAYGPTKAALNNLAESLYLDLRPRGLGVSIVNPGFVETPLTAQNAFRMPALITPEQAAEAMLQGWAQGRFEMNFPRRFTRWVRLLRGLPDAWYFALVRRATGA
jgi:NAD(P)-dependent dehydrogenase (short-subunit alcohol dehydrogenase family)